MITCAGTGYSEWARVYLGDCLYDARDYWSMGVGFLSVAIWTVALLPQVVENVKTKNVASQSVWFWIMWLLGDVFNVAGCILAHQLPTQTALGIVYFLVTVILLFQYAYYSRSPSVDVTHYISLSDTSNPMARSPFSTKYLLSPDSSSSDEQDAFEGSDEETPCDPTVQYAAVPGICFLLVLLLPFRDVEDTAAARELLGVGAASTWGLTLGWIMSALYFGSRLPQIIKLLHVRRVDGISMTMFALTLLGNATYIASVVLRSTDRVFLLDKLPWLVDAVGTVLQDLFILALFIAFRSTS